jgi:hypothetical protein
VECAAYAARRRLIEGYVLIRAAGGWEEHPGTAQGDDRSMSGWEAIRQSEADFARESNGDGDDLCDVCSHPLGDTL